MNNKTIRKNILLISLLLTGFTAAAAGDTYLELPVKVVFFPKREAVISSRLDGVVTRHLLAPGQRFEAGDTLLELDRQERENQFKRAAALESECTFQLEFARKQLDDYTRLFKESLQSELEVKRKELEFQVAKARLDTAAAERSNAELMLELCTIKAPFAGRVEKYLAREFENVRNGQPLISILDDRQLLAIMHLPGQQLSTLPQGQAVTIKVQENGITVSGVITEIAPRADHRSGTFEVKAEVDNSDHRLNAGMSGILQQKPAGHDGK